MERPMVGVASGQMHGSQPRIYPMAERVAERVPQRQPAIAPAQALEDPSIEEETVVATGRPGYRMASASPRGRSETRDLADNMDVPAFMRKQMD